MQIPSRKELESIPLPKTGDSDSTYITYNLQTPFIAEAQVSGGDTREDIFEELAYEESRIREQLKINIIYHQVMTLFIHAPATEHISLPDLKKCASVIANDLCALEGQR